jgi:hypothetical protein
VIKARKEQEMAMTLDIKTIEAILRQHWELPGDLDLEKLHNNAFKIQVMVGQKYAHQNLKYQLGLIQTKEMQQNLDDQACDRIASDLLRAANA